VIRGRRVLLAVTGGVAAYKSAILARRLIEAGAEVEVLLTDSAQEFIGSRTFAAITGRPAHTSLFDEGTVSPHTELARWCDFVVVAPATASTIGKVAQGISSDLVPATILATTAPVLFAPAMHTEMWEHPATQRNVATLKEFGYSLVGPESGALAGGDVGVGRVAEPEAIVEAVETLLNPDPDAPRVLITAGGTREPVDPVRFIGNRSSGKMGHAIADAAVRRGCHVTLVTTSDVPVLPGVKVVAVETADEMQAAVSGEDADIAVMSAAVADFKPADPADLKIPRAHGIQTIELTSTPDILASVVARQVRPFVVGFAAETGGLERGIAKARSKGVDLLVYNDVTEPGSGFGTDTNRVVIIGPEGETEKWPLLSKHEVASRLIDRVLAEQTAGK
jgi:phosphopantothenoylcysteine decarboxylase/phosphopantothenate--cysteine ligase